MFFLSKNDSLKKGLLKSGLAGIGIPLFASVGVLTATMTLASMPPEEITITETDAYCRVTPAQVGHFQPSPGTHDGQRIRVTDAKTLRTIFDARYAPAYNKETKKFDDPNVPVFEKEVYYYPNLSYKVDKNAGTCAVTVSTGPGHFDTKVNIYKLLKNG